MVKEIKLTQGFTAIVDDEDYCRVATLKWCAVKGKTNMYAWRDHKGDGLYMQDFIWGDVPEGMIVDHKNRDSLDNRRDNFRLATKSQNNANSRHVMFVKGKPTSSKYKGVCWDKNLCKWYAYIRVNYKRIGLGYFIKEEDAALAYNFSALEYFGDFATFNTANVL